MENIFNLDPATADILLKLFLSMLFGMIIGVERLFAHKTASMRTYAMVSMGAALFTMISEIMVTHYLAINPDAVNPLFMPAQIISGIGFLGAGLIIFKDSKLSGITTASSLWVSAGIGLATGFGLFKLASVATLFTLFIFIVLWFVEQRLKKTNLFNKLDDDN